jgi:hypothetical protein
VFICVHLWLKQLSIQHVRHQSVGQLRVDLGGMTSPASATRIKSAKVHCANPGTVIGAMDFNGAWNELGQA